MTEYRQLELFEDMPRESATYYELLGISEQASKMEVKKAYFSMVKKCPPERHPEEFKKYRKAYEVLIDDNERAQYDKLAKVPPKYQQLYNYALTAMEYGDYDDAINQLKSVVEHQPELLILADLLGEIYLRNNNSGNAVKIFERLVRQEPDNGGYQGELARAYHMRGFTKKAVAQYEKALLMDSCSISLWSDLALLYIDARDWGNAARTLEKGIEKYRESGMDDSPLHVQAIFVSINRQALKDISQHLEAIKENVANGSDAEYIIYLFCSFVFNSPCEEDKLEYYCLIISFIDELLPGNDTLTELKTEIHMAYALHEVEKDVNVPEFIIDLTRILLDGCNCSQCTIDRFLVESSFLDDLSLSRKALRYFKKTYRQLFELNEEFYNMVLEPKKERRLIEKNYKEMMRLRKKYPIEFNEICGDGDPYIDDIISMTSLNNETYIRQNKKIGRNDPCPCGSGKKYKRCCGA